MATFSLYTPIGSGVARRDPAHVTHIVNLFMHTMFSVCRSKDLYGGITIFGIFGPDMNTEMGVVIYVLKESPDYISSNIYMGSWSNPFGSSVFADIPFFWHF